MKAAAGKDGTAYRIGGDEFCLLLNCEEERFEEAAQRAAKALTASEKGVEVGASWGRASIPEEAGDPTAALQLADVRMYAQKESRRVATPYREISPAEAIEPGAIKLKRG